MHGALSPDVVSNAIAGVFSLVQGIKMAHEHVVSLASGTERTEHGDKYSKESPVGFICNVIQSLLGCGQVLEDKIGL